MAKGYKIVGIVGVEQSPNCAVRQLSNGKKTVWGSGLLIKELQAELGGKFRIPLVGANLSTIMSTLEQLHELLRAPQN
jgi:predicted secreted protein